MYDKSAEATIVQALIYEIGLSIDSENRIIDQDTMRPIRFMDKNVKGTSDPTKRVYISEYDVKLEPLNKMNTKLMNSLFGLFLDKEQEEENIVNFHSFYLDDEDGNTNRTRVVVKCSKDMYYSDYFFNRSLMYCDAILKIGGSFRLDLHLFDEE